MRKMLIIVINFYQNFVSALLKNILGIDRICRQSPTCSEYTRIAIQKDGIFNGLIKSTVRILRCQPYFNF